MESNREKTVAILKQEFESEILFVEEPYQFLTITLKAERIIEIIQFLYNNPETQFQFLTTLCGIHYPDLNQIAVMYQLHNFRTNQQIRLKIYLSADKPETHTLTNVFAAANWMERETYDFFGVNFIGHPNMKRILNVDDMIFFPLRKEFPLEDQTREDKNDALFGR
ncbi:MAG: NADH-quinone oxidoreductase subunit C [Cyclobacteriaceae bacterium]